MHDAVTMNSIIICLSKSVEGATPRVNANVNHWFGVVMVCQCRLINCHKCVNLVGAVSDGGSY